MKEKIDHLVLAFKDELKGVNDLNSLDQIRVKYLGKQGLLIQMMSHIKELPIEEKKSFGKSVNEAKEVMESFIQKQKQVIDEAILEEKLHNESIDVTLPGYQFNLGTKHPLSIIIEDLEDFFIGQGFHIAEGPELELDLYNFEMMNIAAGHPAREMQDSFYVSDKKLLRTHTSPVQARYMLEAKGKPIAIISPGKTYRRDPDDATHAHQFMQCEGLVVGRQIHFGHLKETLLGMAKHLFGEERLIRLRPSYFPFTEPSVEVDVAFVKKDGTQIWIEVLGAGMVHPQVLNMAGYNPEQMTGFAFGIGIERIAMLKYGVDDIRHFYTNDIRFLKQFGGESK